MTTLSWMVALLSLGLLFLLHKKWKKWKKWWLVAVITALFACSFAGTQLGGWLAGLIRAVLSWPAGWMHATAALLATITVLILIPLVYYGFRHDKKADKWEMAGLILLPLLFIIASGPVASNGGTLVQAISRFGSQGLSYLVQDQTPAQTPAPKQTSPHAGSHG